MRDEKYFTEENMEHILREMGEIFRERGKGTINEMLTPDFVSCSIKEKTYLSAYKTVEWMRNPNGTLHGGFMSSTFDNAMGVLANFYGKQSMTQTVSMQISYLSPGSIGERFMIRSRVLKAGRTMQYLNAEAWMEGKEEKLVATATGVYYTLGDRKLFEYK